MSINFRKLDKNLPDPFYATEGAAGFDICCVEGIFLPRWKDSKLVKTGMVFEIPSGFELQIRPRSGISKIFPCYISNSPATIDSDYRGEVLILVVNNNVFEPLSFPKYTRIAQGIIAPVIRATFIEVDQLTHTDRGSGGFGSTGIDIVDKQLPLVFRKIKWKEYLQ